MSYAMYPGLPDPAVENRLHHIIGELQAADLPGRASPTGVTALVLTSSPKRLGRRQGGLDPDQRVGALAIHRRYMAEMDRVPG